MVQKYTMLVYSVFLPDNMQTRDFGVQCSLAIPHLTSSPLGHGSTATDSEMSDVEQEFEDPNTSYFTLSQSSLVTQCYYQSS